MDHWVVRALPGAKRPNAFPVEGPPHPSVACRTRTGKRNTEVPHRALAGLPQSKFEDLRQTRWRLPDLRTLQGRIALAHACCAYGNPQSPGPTPPFLEFAPTYSFPCHETFALRPGP